MNPIAPAATTAGAIALGLTLAGAPAAVAGPLDGWFGLFAAAPETRSAEAAEGTVAPAPATEAAAIGAHDDDSAALRERLAAAERRVAELEAELEKTKAQAAWLGEELEASWRWIEELNAVLADERPAADGEPVETATAPEREPTAAGTEGMAPVETATAAPERERTTPAAEREPVETAAEREPVETAAEREPVETAAAPRAANDRGRPGDADGGGIAARLARVLDDRERPGGGDDGIAARLARALQGPGSPQPEPDAPAAVGGGLPSDPREEEAGPPAAAAQQPQQQQANGDAPPHYAATQAVNLRAEPTTSARVLAVVEADGTVRLLDRDRGWFRVRYTTPSSREVTGWVYGEFLRQIQPGDALAALEPRA